MWIYFQLGMREVGMIVYDSTWIKSWPWYYLKTYWITQFCFLFGPIHLLNLPQIELFIETQECERACVWLVKFTKNIFDELNSATSIEIRKETDTRTQARTHEPIQTKKSIILLLLLYSYISAAKCQRIQYRSTTTHKTIKHFSYESFNAPDIII